MAVPLGKVDVYAREHPAELHRAPMIETRYFSFNTQRRPLNDPRVRRALALAIDRQTIVDRVVKGGHEAATRFVPAALREQTSSASSLREAEHRFDPDAGRKLLAAAGIPAKDFPKLELTAWSSSQAPVLEAVQQMWKRELGLDVAIAIREARVHWSALESGDYDIAFVTAIPDVADIAQLLGDFVTGAHDNHPHWSDRKFDDAFNHAVRTLDPRARNDAFLAAEQILLGAAPLTPVYFNTRIWLMSPRVRGWQEDGLWSRCYQQVYLDEK